MAFFLSVILAIFEIQRYRLSLHFKIQCYVVEYFNENESVVLFRLSFVNPASTGKTINRLRYSHGFYKKHPVYGLKQITIWREPQGLHDMNQRTVIFELPNQKKVMPYDEMLECPLDIPPHESRIRWYYLIASLDKETPQQFSMVFQAFDIYEKKPLAKDSIMLLKNDLMTIGLHYQSSSPPISIKS